MITTPPGTLHKVEYKFAYAWYNDVQKDNNCRCGHESGRHSQYFNQQTGKLEIMNCDFCHCNQFEQRIADLPLGTVKALGLNKDDGLWKLKLELIN